MTTDFVLQASQERHLESRIILFEASAEAAANFTRIIAERKVISRGASLKSFPFSYRALLWEIRELRLTASV